MSSSVSSIRDVAAAVRGRRLNLGLSQSALAARAHVSRQWISEFESGKPTAELGLVLKLLEALGLRIALELEEEERVLPPTAPTASVDLDTLLDEYRAG